MLGTVKHRLAVCAARGFTVDALQKSWLTVWDRLLTELRIVSGALLFNDIFNESFQTSDAVSTKLAPES